MQDILFMLRQSDDSKCDRQKQKSNGATQTPTEP